MLQYILNEAEHGHCVSLLAIDYSKAFDKVDITVAMHKLLKMNVRRELLPWVADFYHQQGKMCLTIISHIHLVYDYMWCPTRHQTGSYSVSCYIW